MCGLHPQANLWESSDTLGKSLAMAPSSALAQRPIWFRGQVKPLVLKF